MSLLRVSLIEDDASTRARWKAWLREDEGFLCTAEFASTEQALPAWNRHTADVALVDLCLPGADGTECVRQLRRRFPALLFLVCTAVNDAPAIYTALQAGAHGYLLKSAPREAVLEALRDVKAGGAPMSPGVGRKVLQFFHGLGDDRARPPGMEMLTARELEVLERVSAGGTNKEIAAALGVTIDTIKAHCRGIYEKLHVSNRAEAAARFARTPRPHLPGG